MEYWYDIKDRGIMGSGNGEIKVVTILGRTVRWTREGLEYEADGKHRRELLKRLGLNDGAKAVVSPMVKSGKNEVGDEDDELEKGEYTGFRGEVALLNYMGQDRSDVQYTTNQVSRMMVRPTVGARRLVKRVGRYLVGAERVVWKYGDLGEKGMELEIDVYVDSDWAGGVDRKSTSGGVVMMGGVAVKHWSRTQRSRALSSGEAEYYAVVTGTAEGLGVQSLGVDMGIEMKVRVWTDSDASRSVASRRGVGKLRHVELKYLWVQEVVKSGRVTMKRVNGVDNVADHLTKPKMGGEMARMIQNMGGEVVWLEGGGRQQMTGVEKTSFPEI
jgi:hypothetical protein